MGLPESMTRAEISEAVPPAYAECIAREALRQMVGKPPTSRRRSRYGSCEGGS